MDAGCAQSWRQGKVNAAPEACCVYVVMDARIRRGGTPYNLIFTQQSNRSRKHGMSHWFEYFPGHHMWSQGMMFGIEMAAQGAAALG